MGFKVMFTAILTDLDLNPDTPLHKKNCIYCNKCVKNCPINALNKEGRTDVMKCLSNSQPYGLNSNKQFWMKYHTSTPQDREKMLNSNEYRKIYQAQALGSQYT